MGSVEMLPDRLAVAGTKECPRKGARPWITKAWVLGTLECNKEGSVDSPPQTSGPWVVPRTQQSLQVRWRRSSSELRPLFRCSSHCQGWYSACGDLPEAQDSPSSSLRWPKRPWNNKPSQTEEGARALRTSGLWERLNTWRAESAGLASVVSSPALPHPDFLEGLSPYELGLEKGGPAIPRCQLAARHPSG